MSRDANALPSALAAWLQAEGVAPLCDPLPSESMADTGHWWKRSPIWVVLTRDRVILRAEGPSPFNENILPEQISNAFYNAMTGCLVFPTDDPHYPVILRVPPGRAETILTHLQKNDIQPTIKTHA